MLRVLGEDNRPWFWRAVFSLDTKGICQVLAQTGPLQHITRRDALFHLNLLRNWSLRARDSFDARVINEICHYDIHPLFLSMLRVFIKEPGIFLSPESFALLARNGHVNTLREALRCFPKGRSDWYMAQILQLSRSDDFRAGFTLLAEHVLSFCPSSVSGSGRVIQEMLYTNDLSCIKRAMQTVNADSRCSQNFSVMAAVKSCDLHIIKYLHQHYPEVFPTQALVECAAEHGRVDAVEWLLDDYPGLCIDQLLEWSIQSVDTNVATVKCLVSKCRPLGTRKRLTVPDLGVLHYLKTVVYPKRVLRFNQPPKISGIFDKETTVPLLPWLRAQPDLEPLAEMVFFEGLRTLDLPVLRALKAAGFILQGSALSTYWMVGRKKKTNIDSLRFLHAEGVVFENVQNAFGRASFDEMKWFHQSFTLVYDTADFKSVIESGRTDAIAWMNSVATFAADIQYLQAALTSDALEWLLLNRDDPIEQDIMTLAVALDSAQACRIILQKNPTAVNAATALLIAANKDSVEVVRWLLRTFPIVDEQLAAAHSLTVNDIRRAHVGASRNRVGMYLEVKYRCLFTHFPATGEEQQRSNRAKQLIAEYEEQRSMLLEGTQPSQRALAQ